MIYWILKILLANVKMSMCARLLCRLSKRISYGYVSRQEHTGRVFRLQFDEFQIVSSSHDDTILIWDFLNSSSDGNGTPNSQGTQATSSTTTQVPTNNRTPSRMYLYHIPIN